MNKNIVFSTLMALSVAVPGIALAQGYDRDNRDRNEHAQNEHAQDERGAGPQHAYHKGDRLPAREHTKEYEVNDWRSRGLREPPEGHHWVRSGDDYVLAAIATGVIADIALSHH